MTRLSVSRAAFVAAVLVLLLTDAGTVQATHGPDPTRTTPGPHISAEPAYTKGLTNTIRWEALSGPWCSSWGCPPELSDRGYVVTIVDVGSGAQRRLAAPGKDANSLTVHGLEAGHAYRYVVRARWRDCARLSPDHKDCIDRTSFKYTYPSDAVTSTQDTTLPFGTVTIEGGAQFTNRLAANVQLAATDPDSAASGVGYVQFSPDGSFACATALGCAIPYAPQLGVTLAPGPDGPRTLFARFYDRARGPAASPTPSAFEHPPGNVSAATSDTILLDTTGPVLSVVRSAEPAMMNVPVSFNASASRDQGGFGADSGLDAATAVWDFGDGTNGTGLAVTHTYTQQGAFNASLSIQDRAGNESRLAFVVNVSPTAPGGGTTTTGTPTQNPPQADTTGPTLSGVRLVRRARITFSLSEPATVFLEVRRLRPRPLIAIFRVIRSRGGGSNVISLPAKIRGRFARGGRYRILLAARDAAGNASRVNTITIRGARR
jgi:PKD domain